MVEKISPRAGLELETARSVGKRLIHLATGAPVNLGKTLCILIPLHAYYRYYFSEKYPMFLNFPHQLCRRPLKI